MDFWNMAVPTLLFLAPALGIVLLAWRPEGERRVAAAVFGAALLTALVGVVRFDQAVKMELLLALSTEPSGYFEFAFQLHWIRFLWIAFAAALLLAFSGLDRAPVRRGGGQRASFSFLLGAFFFAALAFLSENTILSLMFLEVMSFLLYAFTAQAEGREGEGERISYFKRASFLFLSLLATVALAATGQFGVNSIILLGLVLYTLSTLFAKHSYASWRYSALVTLQAGALFFFLGRIMKEGMSPELWVPLAGIFGLGSAIFAGFSLTALSNLGVAFWSLLSFTGYLFFLRFSSGRPDDQFWGAYEAVGLLSAYALAQLYRHGRLADQPVKKALSFFLSFLLLAVVSGAVPGADAGLPRAATSDPVRLVAFGTLTFLLALSAGKALVVSFGGASDQPEGETSYFAGALPALLTLLAQVGAVARIVDIYGENPYRLGLPYLVANPLVLVAAAALALGFLAGGLLGANAAYLKWAKVKERRMEDLFPRIDPSIVRWNEALARVPERFFTLSGAGARALANGVGSRVEAGDRSVFGERFYQGFRSNGAKLSGLVRHLHSGQVRAYLFLGALVTLFSALLFLTEGP